MGGAHERQTHVGPTLVLVRLCGGYGRPTGRMGGWEGGRMDGWVCGCMGGHTWWIVDWVIGCLCLCALGGGGEGGRGRGIEGGGGGYRAEVECRYIQT